MKNNCIKENPFVKACLSSAFSVEFNNFCKKDITLIHGLLKYTNWHPKVDIFQYLTCLTDLRNDKKTYFVFDASTEGFSPFKMNFFHILYANCRKYQIPPNKIIFVSANMQDHKNLKKYNLQNNIKESIHVFCFLSFRRMIADLVEQDSAHFTDFDRQLKQRRKQTEMHFSNKLGLSLSRVNREHRTLASYMLCRGMLKDCVLISQDTVPEQDLKYVAEKYGFDILDMYKWGQNLPIVADTEDFETNHALVLNSHLHDSTLFQIVNETHANNYNNTSIFFSEKTFRSIAHCQPFLIFGQQDCNQKLKELGFELYEEYFDYDFDSVDKVRKRYEMLLKSVSRAVTKLKGLNRLQQIDWKFALKHKLQHNFECVMQKDHEREKFLQLIEKL